MLTMLLSFAVPAIVAHFAVGAAAPLLAQLFGAAAAPVATKAANAVIAKGVRDLVAHVANGGEITPEQRDWLQAHRQELHIAPKTQPEDDSRPPVWTVPTQSSRG